MAAGREDFARIVDTVRGRFEAQKRVLSFEEYLELVVAHPERHTRDAARYLKGCFDHLGTYEIERPWGSVRRFRLFDLPFTDGRGATRRSDHLVGHEAIQEEFYRILSNFGREGRPNRLILLHGPNGSAKTTFAHAIMIALENYSWQDEGALYRFSWIFPRGRDGKSIGFGSADEAPPGRTFAHLPDAQIEVKMTSELREHPLLLLPLRERRELIARIYEEQGIREAAPDWLWNGQLGHKNKEIYEALLTAYRGDISRVLFHVRVERYYISRRYRLGAVTIGPQMHVDASERQITADRTISSLPASLSSLTLFEPYGELVDASGGIVEFSDLLKRPLDAWKYLLLAIETGEVPLPLSNLPLNTVMVASSNEVHLAAFKEHHEYNSFRGRLQLVRVPYLLDYTQERQIYDSQIVPQVQSHVSPHATYVAALWAVLTRLRRAQADRYENAVLGRVAADLTAIEKADLYALGKIPERLDADDARELRSGTETVYRESEMSPDYEGLTGASPREIRMLLLDAAHDPRYEGLSPLAVIDRIEAFCARGDYQFLKQTPDRGYFDHRGFIRIVHTRWLDLVDGELRSATGLIEETQYRDLFDRYVMNVSYWVKNERIQNPVTGKYEDPDQDLMSRIESRLDVDKDAADEFRRNMISTIGGAAISRPGQKVDYGRLFPRYIERLREAYYEERRKQVGTIARDILRLLHEEPLEPERDRAARDTMGRMSERFGYSESSLRDAMGEIVRDRYPQ